MNYLNQKKRSFSLLVILTFLICFSSNIYADYLLIMGNCTSEIGGSVYGREFWEKKPALQGTLIHNFIFDMWADMGFLALGAGIDKNIKHRVRPDFYFDGVIRDIKPLTKGKNKEQIVKVYQKQLKKYVDTVFDMNGGAYYPDVEILFYELDHEKKSIKIFEKPYKVDLEALGITGKYETKETQLEALSKFTENIGNLRAVIRDKNGHFILVGEKKEKTSRLEPDDFMVAFNAVYNTNYSGAMVTIDPDPENSETRGIVRFGGNIEGSHIGNVLFESDRLLKCLGQGYDNLEDKPLASSVKDFKTMQELLAETKKNEQKTQWIRFWFKPLEMDIFSVDDVDVLIFPKNLMGVKTENMRFDGKELISDFTADPESAQAMFVKHFNDHFDSFADEFPVFRELQEIAKVMATFKWIYERKLSIDVRYLAEAEIRTSSYPKYTPLIKSTRTENSQYVQNNYLVTKENSIDLIGGVDMQDFVFKEVTTTERYKEMVTAVLKNPDNKAFQFGDRLYMRNFLGTPSIPNMELRKGIIESCRELMTNEERDKIRIGTDQYGRVVVYTDANSTTYFFEYDDFGRMKSVKGWDQPINYEYKLNESGIHFKYQALFNTNQYEKRFQYVDNTDQVKRIEILKNEELQHSFLVKIDRTDLIVERGCD